MKRILLGISTFLLGSTLTAQTTIDFDDDAKWTAGSGGGITSYQPDHQYVDGDFSAIGGDGLRQGNTAQGGAPGALGTYSWRLRNNTAVVWTATIATGGISTFSLDARAWDNSPSPDYKIEVSTNMGSSWDSITTINNTSLSNTDDWVTFNGTVNSGNADVMVRLVPNGSTERIMIDNFTWSPFGAALDTTATITTTDMSVMENVGTVDVTIELNQTPVLDKTVDLVLTSGNAAVLGNYTTQSVTFTGGSTSETVTINVTPGQLGSASETFDFSISNPSTDLVLGSDTDFQLTVNQLPAGPAACSDLFFSEYIESSSNKALEIYNPTTQVISLSDYQIRRYSNGGSTPSATHSLSGMLIPGEVYVITNAASDATLLAESDLLSSVATFNGNDAMELYKVSASSAVDIIGEIGVDPGTSWYVNTDSTENVTMVRKATVDAGNLTWIGGSDQEWDTYGLNEYSYIGSHTNTGCAGPTNPVAYPIGQSSYCVGDTIVFTHTSFGGTAPYTVQWTIGGIPVSTADTVSYEATTATSLSVVLQVTDDNSIVDDSTFTITINNTPSASFTLSANTICAEDTATITSTGSGVGLLSYSYSVFPSAVLSTGGATGNGYFTSANTGNFEIIQTLTDFTGCMDTALLSVTVNPLSDATFAPLADICDDEVLTLVHPDNSGTWSGTSVTDGGNGMGDFASTSAGDHYISYTTSGTCPDTYTDTVEVFSSPTANFTHTGSITVNFTDASTGSPSAYSWDFGDGNTATQASPTHTYSADGTYTVCLIVDNASGCDDTLCQSVTIFGLGVSELMNSKISFYPNPTSDELTIQTEKPMNVVIYNVIGEQVLNTRINANRTISLAHLEKGSYFIQFENNGERLTEKLIIK